MSKYYRVYQDGDIDEVLIGSSDEWDEAFKIARDAWDKMTPDDRKHNDIRVLHFFYDIDDGDRTCFEYNSYDWFLKYLAYKDDQDLEPLDTFDWDEAYGAVHNCPEGYIDTIDYRSGCCLETEEVQDIREYMEIY